VRLWFFSFYKDDFLGGAFAEGEAPEEAAFMLHVYGANPGGAALVMEVPAGIPDVPKNFMNRLLQESELETVEKLLFKGSSQPRNVIPYKELN
jgi:hypothetical protein